MHKATTMNEKVERSGLRIFAAVSLAYTLAAFGCTTNRTAAAPTTTPAGNPPMASSAIPIDPTRPSSVDAVAILAADQAYQGRVLGKVNPDGGQSNGPVPATGQFVNPALVVNPLSTVNSSVSSAQTAPGITGGPVGRVAIPVMTPASAATTAAATNAAVAAPTSSAIATPSNAAISATSNATTARNTSAVSTAKASTVRATTSKAKTSRKTARATAAVKTPTTAQPVRLETNPSGDVVVTNTNPPKQ